VLGTPHFMAPEQFDDAKSADRRCDVYGLAATLYLAVTGEAPFHAPGYLTIVRKKLAGELTPPRQLAPDLSPQAEQAIRRALSVSPAQRPACCAEFVDELTGTLVVVDKPRPADAPAAVAGPRGSGASAQRVTVRYPC